MIKKLSIFMLVASMLFVTSCGSTAKTTSVAASGAASSIAESTSSKKSIQDILSDTPIKIEDIDWVIQQGNNAFGKPEMLFNYVNNSKFKIVYMRVNYTQKKNVTDAEREEAVKSIKEADKESGESSYTEDQYKDMGLMWYTTKECAPGGSETGIACQIMSDAWHNTNTKPDLMGLYKISEPSIMKIKYTGTDSKTHEITYDFTSKAYTVK